LTSVKDFLDGRYIPVIADLRRLLVCVKGETKGT